eukprot:gnl/Trimastix_PCT/2519.p1 GENE.gnl/Trimastix_PCT/2519~~gnl/Trimastix_PCT/2519.p1  ORF type:complete len:365 (+),score=61.60 gnl/Trimastix_PCT/2519:44-1138(+)
MSIFEQNSLSESTGHADIDEQIRELQSSRLKTAGDPLSVSRAHFDSYLYGSEGEGGTYVSSIPANEQDEEQEAEAALHSAFLPKSKGGWRDAMQQYNRPQQLIKELAMVAPNEDPFEEARPSNKIADREDEYRARRLQRKLTAPQLDPFATGHKTKKEGAVQRKRTARDISQPVEARSYKEIMAETLLEREYKELQDKLERQREEERQAAEQRRREDTHASGQVTTKRPRWDDDSDRAELLRRHLKYTPPDDAAAPETPWRLFVFKRGTQVGNIPIEHDCILLGRNREAADVRVEHPSCSNIHAIIQFRRTRGETRPFLYDNGSTNGTKLAGAPVPPKEFVPVPERVVFRFGRSEREYYLIPQT